MNMGTAKVDFSRSTRNIVKNFINAGDSKGGISI